MKVGSIVVVIYPLVPDAYMERFIKWIPIADKETHYMIRGFEKCTYSNCEVAYLEEGIVGYNIHGNELGLPISALKEVLPPQSSEELTEQLNIEEYEISNT